MTVAARQATAPSPSPYPGAKPSATTPAIGPPIGVLPVNVTDHRASTRPRNRESVVSLPWPTVTARRHALGDLSPPLLNASRRAPRLAG